MGNEAASDSFKMIMLVSVRSRAQIQVFQLQDQRCSAPPAVPQVVKMTFRTICNI